MTENNKKMIWELDSIFPGGSLSPELADYMDEIQADILAQKDVPLNIKELGKSGYFAELTKLIIEVQKIFAGISQVMSFAWCLRSQDVTDEDANTIIERSTSFEADLEAIMTDMDSLLVDMDDADWQEFLNNDEIKPIAFYWNERRLITRHKMMPELEKIGMKLAVDGYHGWSRLYDNIAGDLKVEFVDGDENSTLSLGQLQSKFS